MLERTNKRTQFQLFKSNSETRFKCQYDNIIGSLWDYVIEIDGFCFPKFIDMVIIISYTDIPHRAVLQHIRVLFRQTRYSLFLFLLSRSVWFTFFLLYFIITIIFQKRMIRVLLRGCSDSAVDSCNKRYDRDMRVRNLISIMCLK